MGEASLLRRVHAAYGPKTRTAHGKLQGVVFSGSCCRETRFLAAFDGVNQAEAPLGAAAACSGNRP